MAELGPQGQPPPVAHSGPGLRSLLAFASGVVMLAVGLAAVVSDLTPLALEQTLSVAALAAGVVLLVALVAAPRG